MQRWFLGTRSEGGTIIFPRGGIAIGKKIVCMRKFAEINCLHQRCIRKKCVCRSHSCYAKFGELKKIVCTVSRGKDFESAQSLAENNFLPPGNHDTSQGKNNGPSLRYSYLRYLYLRILYLRYLYLIYSYLGYYIWDIISMKLIFQMWPGIYVSFLVNFLCYFLRPGFS